MMAMVMMKSSSFFFMLVLMMMMMMIEINGILDARGMHPLSLLISFWEIYSSMNRAFCLHVFIYCPPDCCLYLHDCSHSWVSDLRIIYAVEQEEYVNEHVVVLLWGRIIDWRDDGKWSPDASTRTH